jgi:uncharacterized protein (DUF1330 family)
MSAMSAYCVVDILEIVDAVKMDAYRQQVAATVERYGGRYIVRGGPCEVKEGDWRPVFPVILEFPNLEQLRGWYGSAEYAPLLALRLAAARCDLVFIEGA